MDGTRGKHPVVNAAEPGLVSMSYGPGSWLPPSLVFAEDLGTVTLRTKRSTSKNVSISSRSPQDTSGSERPSSAAQEVAADLDSGAPKGIPIRNTVPNIPKSIIDPQTRDLCDAWLRLLGIVVDSLGGRIPRSRATKELKEASAERFRTYPELQEELGNRTTLCRAA